MTQVRQKPKRQPALHWPEPGAPHSPERTTRPLDRKKLQPIHSRQERSPALRRKPWESVRPEKHPPRPVMRWRRQWKMAAPQKKFPGGTRRGLGNRKRRRSVLLKQSLIKKPHAQAKQTNRRERQQHGADVAEFSPVFHCDPLLREPIGSFFIITSARKGFPVKILSQALQFRHLSPYIQKTLRTTKKPPRRTAFSKNFMNHIHPSATSSAIMTENPTAKKMVPILECLPSDISGISSSTTT